MKTKLMNYITAGVIGLSSIFPSLARAEDKHEVFAGTVVTTDEAKDASFDTLAHYVHIETGAKAVVEHVTSPWLSPSEHDLSIGIRSPKFFDKFSLNFGMQGDPRTKNLGYTGMLEVYPLIGKVTSASDLEMTLRACAGADQQGRDVEFAGGRLRNRYLTIDGDFYNTQNVLTRGFVSGIIPTAKGDLYLAFGGEIKDKELTNIVPVLAFYGNTGLYAFANIDLVSKVQSGKIILVPSGSVFTRNSVDFRTHIKNRTAGRGNTALTVLDEWAPFDANLTDGVKGHYVITADFFNSSSSANANANLSYRPMPELFLGLGAGYIRDKKTERNDGTVGVQVYGAIPKTPLEAWLRSDLDVRTGKILPQGYIGVVETF